MKLMASCASLRSSERFSLALFRLPPGGDGGDGMEAAPGIRRPPAPADRDDPVFGVLGLSTFTEQRNFKKKTEYLNT